MLVVGILAIYFSGMADSKPTIAVADGCEIYFTDKRPDQADEKILLCVPAAYTTGKGAIIGHYSTGGRRKGASDYRFTTIHLDRGSHFQQASLVKNHTARSFSDRRHRFRRALCKKEGRYYIVHSRRPVTLTAFGRQLRDYDRAWNLDMGTYAYGWHRDGTGLHRLGMSTIWNAGRQSNWIVVRRK